MYDVNECMSILLLDDVDQMTLMRRNDTDETTDFDRNVHDYDTKKYKVRLGESPMIYM